jgi:hypothetical protein
MDPFLENPALWADVHHEILSEARAVLSGRLRPRYGVRIEERVYISDENDPGRTVLVPDLSIVERHDWAGSSSGTRASTDVDVIEPIVEVTMLQDEIHEPRIEIIDFENKKVVTVIEVLSPSNKVLGSRGRASFESKRREVLDSSTHWVEIDLLRSGERVWTRRPLPPCEYLVHVSRMSKRPKGLIWPIRLPQRLPSIPIPLKLEDPDASLELQTVLDTAYDRAGYDLSVDYSRDPTPPLPKEWEAWADKWLEEKGVREKRS